MKILRNREMVHVIIIWEIVTIFIFICFHRCSIGLVVLLESIIFLLVFIIFQWKQYYEIRMLSKYLQKVYEGKEIIDIRDYKEGELSILKSDIYKLIVILKQQKEILEKDKVFLSQSLNNISHQLKTPLTSMMILNDIMMKDDIPKEKRREFQIQIRLQLQRMEWLIKTLLKLAKIDAEAVTFDKKLCSLDNIINECIDSLKIPMELKNIKYKVICKQRIQICVDKHWIKEAFINIFKNCIEHTKEDGNIIVECEEYPFQINVMVRDNGCGIAQEDIPHIFERFYKGKNTSKDSVGIGLALTKSILTQHQATIKVQSEINKGTCFHICFYKK